MDAIALAIISTAAGSAAGALASPGVAAAVAALARARARRVRHVDVSGADLFACGVPMTEAQFRDVFAAFQAALDELPPVGERSEWDMKRQFAAVQRLAVLAGTHPHAFPSLGDPDEAWQWYAENNPYAVGHAPADPLAPGGRRAILPGPPWPRLRFPGR